MKRIETLRPLSSLETLSRCNSRKCDLCQRDAYTPEKTKGEGCGQFQGI